MSKEHKIGDILEYEGTRLKVVEDFGKDCGDCYFYQIYKCDAFNMQMSEIVGLCDALDRSDRNYIIYVKED